MFRQTSPTKSAQAIWNTSLSPGAAGSWFEAAQASNSAGWSHVSHAHHATDTNFGHRKCFPVYRSLKVKHSSKIRTTKRNSIRHAPTCIQTQANKKHTQIHIHAYMYIFAFLYLYMYISTSSSLITYLYRCISKRCAHVCTVTRKNNTHAQICCAGNRVGPGLQHLSSGRSFIVSRTVLEIMGVPSSLAGCLKSPKVLGFSGSACCVDCCKMPENPGAQFPYLICCDAWNMSFPKRT